MGKDKFENEELLKYGFPEEILSWQAQGSISLDLFEASRTEIGRIFGSMWTSSLQLMCIFDCLLEALTWLESKTRRGDLGSLHVFLVGN